MNKKVVLGAAVVLVPVYVAASWGLGRAAHAHFDRFEQSLNEQAVAIFKIADRTYTPGVFTSEERFTFELNKEIFGEIFESKGDDDVGELDSLDGDDAELQDATDEYVARGSNETPRITVLHKIQHGPLPGFRSLGLARIESTLELSEAVRAEIAEVLGDNEPLLVTSLIGFTGAGSSTITSPAFEYDDDGEKLSWQGFEANFNYGRDISSLECDFKAPGMELTDKNGVNARLGEISFVCDLERAFDSLYVGTAAVNIAFMHHAGPAESVEIEQISYATDIRKDGDYVDMGLDLGVGRMVMEGFTINDVRYDLAINHLHGPTYAAMQRELEESVAASATNDPAGTAGLFAAFGEYLPQLLEHSPQLVIERIGFSMPEGETGLKGTIQLKDFTRDDLAEGGSMALLAKLDASVDVWMSAGLLTRDWTRTAPNAQEDVSDGPSAAEKIEMMQMQVAQLEQQGYIKRSGDRFESHIEFKSGALTANGKPLGPMGGGQ